jgi:hypothetical protein
MILSTLHLIIRFSLLAALTFLFVVLYEHGPENYLENVERDARALVAQLAEQTSPKKSPNSGT